MELVQQAFSQAAVNLGTSLSQTLHVFSYAWYVALPAMLFPIFMIFWLYHIRVQYWLSLDWMLLEIIPPKDIEKSPKPMEALFAGMAGVEKGFLPTEIYVQGMFADSFSLELVSDGGQVHFYIRTLRKYRHLVEAHLYAQYPDVEVREAEDYVNDVPKVVPNKQWDLWGTDFELTKADAFPIRTYDRFEESVTGKMIDPLSGLVEAMGKLPPGQKIWLQYVITPLSPAWAAKEGRKAADKLKGKVVEEESFLSKVWTDLKDVIFNAFSIGALKGEVKLTEKSKKDEQPLEFRLSPVERDVLKAVEDSLGKIFYDVKMRMILIGRKQGFDKTFVSSFIGGIKQFNDDNLNGFKPDNDSKTFANFVFIKPRLRFRQRKILGRYRSRSDAGKTFALNTEELATVFHLPDMQVVAPSVTRVEARRSGAPANLPIE